MNLPLLYSGVMHVLVFLMLFFFIQPGADKAKATYTIDFIGTASQPMRYGTPESAPAPKAAAKAETPAKQPESEIKVKQQEAKKAPAKPAYNAKEQISKKAKKNAKTEPKAEPKKEEKVVLSKPSILGDVEATNIDVSKIHEMGPGDDGIKAVKASFTNFPYPWYITQVRNALWKEWSKRMPNKAGFSTLVSFNIDKYGAVYGVQIEKSSGNESYDYAATSAATNSAPYPPLPKDFGKDILTVTVEFKNED